MQVLGPAPETLTPEQILQQYPEAIDQLIKAAVDPQHEFERQILINQARQNWMFVKGKHFFSPGSVDTPYGTITDYIPFDPGSSENENGAESKLCPPINVIGGDCYKFVAVMGQEAPHVKGVADDSEDSADIEKARNADASIRDSWLKQKLDRRWGIPAFHQYTTGPTYIRGIWVQDRRKYGQEVTPQMDFQEGPDGVQIPVEGQPQVYENGDAEVQFCTVLEVSHPFMAKDLDECQWFTCETMRSKWDLLAMNPDKLKAYREQELPDDDSQMSSVAANEAREAAANPSGMGRQKRPDQWRFREFWFQPFMLEAIVDDEARAVFQGAFPDGIYIQKVGKIKTKIDNRNLTDEWTVCKVGRGEKILERPIASDVVPINRAINDIFGMGLETLLRAITQTIIDNQILDRHKLSSKEAVPVEFIPTLLPVDGDLNKKIFQVPPAHLSDQLVPFLTSVVRPFMQDISGVRPELAGGGAPTQTYREARQRRDQALMQLSPHSKEMLYAAEDLAKILVKLRAKYGSGTIKSQKRGAYGVQTDVVDLAQLSESGWHPEADSNFPLMLSDRRDQVFSILKEFPPDVQQALSILDPINIDSVIELLQIPGFESAVQDQREKTLADIQQLLQAQPVDGPDGNKQPSLPIDPYDNHQVVSDFMAKWMISRKGQMEKNRNPGGFANVEAAQAAHSQAAQPPTPPAAPTVRTALNVSAKLEDMTPEFTQEILGGANLPANPAAAALPPPPEVPAAPPGGVAAPGPVPEEAPIPDTGPSADHPIGPMIQ